MRAASTRRFCIAIAFLASVNALGWVWVQRTTAAGAVGTVRVVGVTPEHPTHDSTTLTVRFDRAVAEPAWLQRPLDLAPYGITPLRDGVWVWTAPDALTFRLAEPLPPGRVFALAPQGDFGSRTGSRLVGDGTVRVETPRLRLVDCAVQSVDSQHVTYGLTFNQPVNPHDLARALKVDVRDGARTLEVPFEPLGLRPAERLVLRSPLRGRGALTLTLDAELKGHDADLGLERAVEQRLEVPDRFMLLNAYVPTPGVESAVRAHLNFSRTLDRRQPVPQVQVEPPVADLTVRHYYGDLLLEGAFTCGRRYTVGVPPTLLDEAGRTLDEHATIAFRVPDRAAAVRLPIERGFLMPSGNLTLDLDTVNVSRLQVTARRVHANNIVPHLSGAAPGTTARDLPMREIPLAMVPNVPLRSALRLSDVIDDPLGVYHLAVRSVEGSWRTHADAVVTVTDLAMTTKRVRDGYAVWVTALSTGAPVADVRVTGWSRNNQRLAESTTSAAGLARLMVDAAHPDGALFVVVAERGDDLSFVEPDRHPWMLDDIDSTGRRWPGAYDVLMYTERGAYRPGEPIHLTGIVRTAAGAVPDDLPVELHARGPDGRTWWSHIATVGAQGFVQADIPTPDAAGTGVVELFATVPGDTVRIGETTALVEAFVPVRIAVDVTPTQPVFAAGEAPTAEIAADYLFGRPAAQLDVEAAAVYRPAPWRHPACPDCSFEVPGAAVPTERHTAEGRLDDAGRLRIALPAPHHASVGSWEAVLSATVTVAGGRSTTARTVVPVETATWHLGLRRAGAAHIVAGAPFDLDWMGIGDDPPSCVDLVLEAVEHDMVFDERDGQLTWTPFERVRAIAAITVDPTLAPRGTTSWTVPAAGLYRLTAATAAGPVSGLEFRAGGSDDADLAPAHPGRVEIVLDQARYRPGQTADVLLHNPFPGTLWVTLESDDIVSEQVVAAGTTARIAMTLPRDLRGGAFISAALVRAIDPARPSWLPNHAAGLARVVLDHGDHALALRLDVAEEAEPGATVSVVVTTESPTDLATPAVAHVWAVDDGLLLATAFDTPDPLTYFLGGRRSGIRTADVFPELLPDHSRLLATTHIGADGAEPDVRRSAVAIRVGEAGVVWRSARPVGADGSAHLDVDLPDQHGAVRVFAVVADGDRYASTAAPVRVTTPVMIESSWPRAVAPGDRFDVPVTLLNTTAESVTVTVALDVNGPLQIDPAASRTVTVPARGETRAWWSARADGTGPVQATITATPTAADATIPAVRAVGRVAVRPCVVPETRTVLHRVAAGETLSIEPDGDMQTDTACTRVVVGGAPRLELTTAVQSLIDYPHGCLEQTTSRLAVLVHAGDLATATTASEPDAIGHLVEAGLDRLWAMQTASGGLAYWPRSADADPWGSAYAGLLLSQVGPQRLQTRPGLLDGLLSYLETRIERASDPNTRALMVRVLAAFDRAQTGWLARLSERPADLDRAGRAHVAAAWLSQGRRDRAAAMLMADTIDLVVAPQHGDRITSAVHQDAVLLDVLLDLDPTHEWIVPLVQRLEAQRAGGRWGHTLETATALAALSRYQLEVAPRVAGRGEVLAAGQRAAVQGTTGYEGRFNGAFEPLRVTAVEGTLYVGITTTGLATTASNAAERDAGLRVRRRWRDRDGHDVDPQGLRVGDWVEVEVTLSAPDLRSADTLERIAVVDVLPGGFEIENPRLHTADHHHDAVLPDHAEFLDDRVLLFAAAQRGPQVFRYALRAVTAGRFQQAPLQASCMYDESVASLHGGGAVEIRQ